MTTPLLLSNGGSTLVDADLLPTLIQHRWHRNGQGYVQTFIAKRCVYLHRLVLNAQKGQIVDHIDGDKLNNTRANLRLVTPSQNQQNRRPRSNTISGFKGVSFTHERWQVAIQVEGRNKKLGCYDDLKLAALIYDQAARHYFGEYARTNFPLEEVTPEAAAVFDILINPPAPIAKRPSVYRGVYWHYGRWRAKIGYQNRTIHLGYFTDEEEAARCYDENAVLLHGKRAKLNFVG